MITDELSRPLRELPDFEAMVRLQSDPELQLRPKETPHPHRHITRNPTLAVHNLADSAGRYPNGNREPMTSNFHRIQELLNEDSSWTKGSILLSIPDPLEVAYYLDFTRAHQSPHKNSTGPPCHRTPQEHGRRQSH